LNTRTISLDASYHQKGEENFDGLEGLLLDVMQGDQSLSCDIDEVETAWRVVDPILKVIGRWSATSSTTYPAGSWGPRATYRLFGPGRPVLRHSLSMDGANLERIDGGIFDIPD